MKTQIVHYHLFKNAGTSLDFILKQNFGDDWVTKEFHGTPLMGNWEAVREWIGENEDKIAFSSHTAMGPLMPVPGRKLFSVMFIRHPIDRLRSAYSFERKQNVDSLGAVLAKETSFAGYLSVRRRIPNERFVTNFHAHRLTSFKRDKDKTELERSVMAMDDMGMVGVVERFDESMQLFQHLIKDAYPDFSYGKMHANKGNETSSTLEERLERTKAEIGDTLWDEILEWNSDDFKIYEYASQLLDERLRSIPKDDTSDINDEPAAEESTE